MKLIMPKFTMTEIICAAVLLLFAVYTHAATDPEKQNKADYNAAIARADADYKVASDACSVQKGHDKEVCIPRDAVADARDDKLVAQYKVAKENARR